MLISMSTFPGVPYFPDHIVYNKAAKNTETYVFFYDGENMKISRYDSLPGEAVLIRAEVFMTEQGFRDEFDDTDHTAFHYVAFDDDGTPVGVCRTFPGPDPRERVFGRLAVRKPWRGKGIGRELISFAENSVREEGAVSLRLHAQVSAAGFYEKLGYTAYGDPDYDEHVLHIWMKKDLT